MTLPIILAWLWWNAPRKPPEPETVVVEFVFNEEESAGNDERN